MHRTPCRPITSIVVRALISAPRSAFVDRQRQRRSSYRICKQSMSFDSLGLSEPLLRAVNELGYTSPTPIQLQAIPAVLNGGDLLAGAQTGTGKTAGFTLPILQRLNTMPPVTTAGGKRVVRALILTPTRE